MVRSSVFLSRLGGIVALLAAFITALLFSNNIVTFLGKPARSVVQSSISEYTPQKNVNQNSSEILKGGNISKLSPYLRSGSSSVDRMPSLSIPLDRMADAVPAINPGAVRTKAEAAAALAAERRKAEESARLAARASALRKQLDSVPALYNTPERLSYGHSTAVTFVLETQGPGSARGLTSGFEGPVVETDVLVSSEVQALLTGPSDLVEIKPRGLPDLQRKSISAIAPVQWTWDVKGIGVGTAVLQLELIAFVGKGLATAPMQIKTFQHSIPIEISFSDRITRAISDLNPVWTAGVSTATAVAGALAYFGFKPGKDKSGAKNDDKDGDPTRGGAPDRNRRPTIYRRGRNSRT